ncbi:MAG: hypothetical protein AAGJ95_09490 [Cyanobacteria bacterium J06554_11]
MTFTTNTYPKQIETFLAKLEYDQLSSYPKYCAQATQTLCYADCADFIAKLGNEYWLFTSESGSLWEITFLGEKLEFCWTDDMIGEADGFDFDAFQNELSHKLEGVQVFRLENVSGVVYKNAFELAFVDQLEEAFYDALENV